VPKYIVDTHPEAATLHGIPGNPELVGDRFMSCPGGWTCKNTNSNIAWAAGFEDAGVEVFIPGSGEAMSTSLVFSYSDGAPCFGYYWSPTPLLGANELVLVDIGDYDQVTFDCNATPDYEAAVQFLTNHPDTWNAWLNDAACTLAGCPSGSGP